MFTPFLNLVTPSASGFAIPAAADVVVLALQRKAVAPMSSIRPEVLAFVKATKELLSSDTDRLPLTDDEMEKVTDCLTKWS